MVSHITSFAQRIGSYLPQNAHAHNVNELETNIQKLQGALSDKTQDVFQTRLSQTIVAVQAEKSECQNQLKTLNGSYYQDPESFLKKSWDKLVEKVLTAIGFTVEKRSDLDTASSRLDEATSETTEPAENINEAQQAIQTFVRLETKRNHLETELNAILSTEKNASDFQNSLIEQKRTLEARQKALCGHYFQDPTGLLDLAWKAFKTAESTGTSDANTLLSQAYLILEEERKNNEAQLFDLGKQLSVAPNPTRSYEALTITSIQEEINSFTEIKAHAEEQAGAGVDWRQTAINTAGIAGSVIGGALTYASYFI